MKNRFIGTSNVRMTLALEPSPSESEQLGQSLPQVFGDGVDGALLYLNHRLADDIDTPGFFAVDEEIHRDDGLISHARVDFESGKLASSIRNVCKNGRSHVRKSIPQVKR